ncbi:XopAW family type III secretion system calcium-binding effector [Acidovorax sp. NCPPB 3576]|uniref:XopAW family type III secretion system calcium-binding effector n=1 Tax=Acidovorax sp. NCPPB 3576 TaxID=2940488 RepID=UPI00234B1FF9|nr:XopAW family type III secretion system calcium-binding effector [Acidovorax sp. NCPPB 3576]WCM87122.1 EF-hand domain-containing protein [Acidovorax sp. NCPPB 3576]
MTTISSVGSAWSSASVQRASRPGPSPERLFGKLDADGSGGVDGTELQGLLDKVAKKSGVDSGTSASDLIQKYDSDGNGSLSSDELSKTLESVLPQRSTMDFAQSRSDAGSGATGQAGDDLFGKVDGDGDGKVSQTELQSLLEKMSGGTASATGTSSDELFGQLDADGDGSLSQAEFDAGRPSGQGGAGGPQAGGMPPPPPGGPGGGGGPGGAGGAGSASASSGSTTYDVLDTNEDGVVSASELAAAATADTSSTSGTSGSTTDAVTALFNAIDTDGDKQLSARESSSFIDQLTRQWTQATRSGTASSSDASSGTASSSDASSSNDSSNASARSSQRLDLAQLAEQARRQYAAVSGGWSGSSTASTLSALA